MLGRSWGTLALILWLLAQGMILVFSLTFTSMNLILGLLAIAAAILIAVGK